MLIGALLRLTLGCTVAQCSKRHQGREGEGMLRNGLEPWHLLVVAIVVIVLFGSKKLPDTARALGKSMRILKSEAKAMKDETPTDSVTVDPANVCTTAESITAESVATVPGESSATAH
jgi:sec-independent protein translocase protein TatA